MRRWLMETLNMMGALLCLFATINPLGDPGQVEHVISRGVFGGMFVAILDSRYRRKNA